MFWSGYSSAHEVHGAIREKYLMVGRSRRTTWLPDLGDEMPVLDANGHATPAVFRGSRAAMIYWSQTAALETHGEIRNLYEKVLGGPRGELQAPPDEMWPGTNIRYNDFQKALEPGIEVRAVTELELPQLGPSRLHDDGIFDSSCADNHLHERVGGRQLHSRTDAGRAVMPGTATTSTAHRLLDARWHRYPSRSVWTTGTNAVTTTILLPETVFDITSFWGWIRRVRCA